MNTDTKVLKLVRKTGSSIETAEDTVARLSPVAAVKEQDLPDQKLLLEIYRTMYLSRRLDDKEIQLKVRTGSSFRLAARVMKRYWPLPVSY